MGEFILAQHQSECQLYVPGLQQQQQQHQQLQHSLPVAVKSEPVLVETIEMAGPMANQFYILDKPQQEIITGRAIGGGIKSKRPLSLNIESAQIEAKNPSKQVGGIVIDTPSNVISSLEFDIHDTLMTSTGLTPTTNSLTPISFFTPGGPSPSCSSQQRSSEMIELNTPATENVSLVSL